MLGMTIQRLLLSLYAVIFYYLEYIWGLGRNIKVLDGEDMGTFIFLR